MPSDRGDPREKISFIYQALTTILFCAKTFLKQLFLRKLKTFVPLKAFTYRLLKNNCI